ncbi:MAG: 50S ribosomal protein L16 [Candidatus Bathyarchaeia archaeon]
MKGKNYRIPRGQPYVRGEYIAGSPQSKIVKFIMGNAKGSYEYRLVLQSVRSVQIRHNALEAARISANKVLLDEVGGDGYLLRVRVYPHVILRENKMIATAGADRLQEGMRRAFGKPIGRAARIKAGDPVVEVYVNEPHLEVGKKALKAAASKLPTITRILIEKVEAAKAS